MNDQYNCLTWRDVLCILNEMPDEVLDMPAQVWLPHDVSFDDYEEFQTFVGLDGYDLMMPASVDNPLSFSTGVS